MGDQMIDLHAAAISQIAQDLTVKRRTGGTYDQDGIYQPDTTETDVAIKASIQQLSGQDLQRLQENQRASDRVKLYSDTELLTSEAGSNVADRFTYKSELFEIENVMDWSDDGGFYKYLARKVGQ